MKRKHLIFIFWAAPILILIVIESIMQWKNAQSCLVDLDNDLSLLLGITSYEAALDEYTQKDDFSEDIYGRILSYATLHYDSFLHEEESMYEFLAENINDNIIFSNEYFNHFITLLDKNLDKKKFQKEYKVSLVSLEDSSEKILFNKVERKRFHAFPPRHFKTVLNTDHTLWYETDIFIGRKILSSLLGTLIFCIVFDLFAAFVLILVHKSVDKKIKLDSFQKTFKNMIIHDMRSPLSVAIATNELLEQDSILTENSMTEKLLSLNKKNLLELDAQISSMLSFVSTARLTQKGNLHSINLNDFVRDMVESYTITSPNTTFLCNIPENVNVFATKESVSSIFRNLIDNSIKYSDKTPKIQIFTIQNKLYSNSNTVDIVIQDNGIGMDEEFLEHVFDEGFRISASKDTTKGFGFGLFVVHEIIASLGWSIEISSIPKQGTKFTIKAKTRLNN